MMGCCCLSWYPLLGAKKFSLVYLNRRNKHQKLAGHGRCRIAENGCPCTFRLFAGSRPTEWTTRREADIQEICNGRGVFNSFMLSVGNDLQSACVTRLTPSYIAMEPSYLLQVPVLSLDFWFMFDSCLTSWFFRAAAGVTDGHLSRLKQKERLWHEWRKCKVRSRIFHFWIFAECVQ